MEKEFKQNMEDFDNKCKSMIAYINQEIKNNPQKVPGAFTADAETGEVSL